MKIMKVKNVLGLFFFSFLLIHLSACSDKNEQGWYDSVLGGNRFERANTLRFYYVDEEGHSLIDPEDLSTFPVRCLEIPDVAPYPSDYKDGLYNGNCDEIRYDETEQLYYYSTCAFGDEKYSNSTFYIYFQGDYDKMDLTYKYTNEDVAGGDGYWAKIISWEFNGKHVYSDDDGLDKKVFIHKSSGNTTISF